MTSVDYQPGNRIGIVRSGMLVVVEEETSTGAINEIWDLLATRPTVDDVFATLTAAFGGSIHSMPSFAVIAFARELHVILRGPLHLSTAPGPAACRISGNEVSRWSERLLPLQDFSLTSDTVDANHSGRAWFPVQEAVVKFGALRLLSSGQPETDRIAGVGPEALPEHVSGNQPAQPVLQEEEPAQPVLQEEKPAPADDESATRTPLPEPAFLDAPAGPVSSPPLKQETPGEAPAAGDDGDEGYDHLWATHIARSAEEAAVREPGDELGGDLGPRNSRAEPLPTSPAVLPAPPPTTEPQSVALPPAVPRVTALIDSVPWAREVPAEPQPATYSPPAQPGESVVEDGYEQTMIAAPRHGAWGGTAAQSDMPSTTTAGVKVLGRLCPSSHANPPEQAQCSRCNAPLVGEPQDVPRPSLGRMRVSTGEVIELERPLVIGRKPSVSRVQSADMPKLVTLAKASREVSGSHVEIRLEGWHVMMRDLKSTNGTVLVRDGQNPRRLDQGEDTMLVSGDVVELGGALSLVFEELR